MTVPEAANALAISRAKFYQLLKQKVIQKRKVGSRTLIAVSELQRFLAAQDEAA